MVGVISSHAHQLPWVRDGCAPAGVIASVNEEGEEGGEEDGQQDRQDGNDDHGARTLGPRGRRECLGLLQAGLTGPLCLSHGPPVTHHQELHSVGARAGQRVVAAPCPRGAAGIVANTEDLELVAGWAAWVECPVGPQCEIVAPLGEVGGDWGVLHPLWGSEVLGGVAVGHHQPDGIKVRDVEVTELAPWLVQCEGGLGESPCQGGARELGHIVDALW